MSERSGLSGREGRGRKERAAAFVQRCRTRLEERRTRVVEQRTKVPPVDIGLSILERDRLTGGYVLAAAVAFRLFLVLLPYTVIVVVLLGTWVDVDSSDPRSTARTLGAVGLAGSAINDAADLADGRRVLTLALAVVALALTGRTLTKTLMIVHGLVWSDGTPPVARPRLVGRVLTGLLGVSVIGLAASAARQIAPGTGVLAILLGGALIGGCWLWITNGLPHHDTPIASLVPGAVLFGIGMLAMNAFMIYWATRKVSSASELYGALGAAVALLGLTFFIGRIVVVAAHLNAVLWDRAHPPSEPVDLVTTATTTSHYIDLEEPRWHVPHP